MTASAPSATLIARVVPVRLGRTRGLLERNLLVARGASLIIISGFFEPLFYLLSIGVGVGRLVGAVQVGAHLVPYRQFVAPAMLASSATNGAIAETTFNVFFKLKIERLYDAVLTTSMGPRDVAAAEITWAVARGGIYSAIFLLVMAVLGLVHSWWALFALPGAVVIGFAFSAAGMAATTWMRTFQDFSYVTLIQLPMFLFSATFYPLSTYPGGLQAVVRVTPLYQGVAMERALVTGDVGWVIAAHAAYLLAVAVAGLAVAGRRLDHLLLR